jgi:hypothetical protein
VPIQGGRGWLKATGNGLNHASIVHGEGDRRRGPTTATTSFRLVEGDDPGRPCWAKWLGNVSRLQREMMWAERKERAEYGQDRWGCTKFFTIFQTII